MKKFITYIAFIVLYGYIMSSCIKEDVNSEYESQYTNFELKIFSSDIDNSPYNRASSTVQPDTQENETEYERTIPNKEAIDIYAFKNDGTYLGQAEIISLEGVEHANYRVLTGKLPKVPVNSYIKLVVMANFKKRDGNIIQPGNFSYTKWKTKAIFNYGNKAWNSTEDKKEGKYIPMSGESLFNVQPMNNISIKLKRAIAKVRIKVDSKSAYNITSITTNNAAQKGFCIEQDKVTTPPNTEGLYETLKFNNINLKPGGDGYEFYLPEQEAKQTTLSVFMSDNSDEAKPVIEFKFYPDGKTYPIQRNYIYEFVISKKEDSKADVHVNILDWTIEDVSTDYE